MKKQIALCAAALLLLGSLSGCGATPQNSPGKELIPTEQESSYQFYGSEALGNRENSESPAHTAAQQIYAPYEQYGLIYDATRDVLTFDGEVVRWFEDYYPVGENETAGIDFLNENGTVDVYAIRDFESFAKATDGSIDPAGKLIGLKKFTQEEFDKRVIQTFSSVAVSGDPWDDSEFQQIVQEYEKFGVTYDANADQWYLNGEKVRYFWDVLMSNGESLTSGKFHGEIRTLESGDGTIDIYTIRDYSHLNNENYGTLTGIEKYSQEEFDKHTQAGMSGNHSTRADRTDCWGCYTPPKRLELAVSCS